MKNKFLYILLLVTLLVGGGLFYWFQVRASVIKSSCAETSKKFALTRIKELIDRPGESVLVGQNSGYKQSTLEEFYRIGKYFPEDYELSFKECLNKNGL